MGKNIIIKLLFINGLLLLLCVAVYGLNRSSEIADKPPIKGYFTDVPNYRLNRFIDLDRDAFEMLKLDDYLFADYEGPNGTVNLYIGYYYSANKAYAAHSPLICYPSQGWQIDNKPQTGQLDVTPHAITYEEIVTSHDANRELVLYWYQTRLFTNLQVYRNKINMGLNKLRFNDPQHGFVRVSVPFGSEDSPEAVRERAINFIRAFYPQFVRYITET